MSLLGVESSVNTLTLLLKSIVSTKLTIATYSEVMYLLIYSVPY